MNKDKRRRTRKRQGQDEEEKKWPGVEKGSVVW
jgi:hypothetical protein